MKETNRHCVAISQVRELPARAQLITRCEDGAGALSSLEIKLCLITDLFQTIINAGRAQPFVK